MKKGTILLTALLSASLNALAHTPDGMPIDDSGPNLVVMGVLTLCGLAGLIVAFVAINTIKKEKKNKDNEITALKNALLKRNEDVDQHINNLNSRIGNMEEAIEDAVRAVIRQMNAQNVAAPAKTEKKADFPKKLFLSRPDDNGRFLAASPYVEPGNSIFLLTTADGVKGTFEVIENAGVHHMALMMPTENLTRACTGTDIQVSAGKTRIVTDAPGEAVKDGSLWKITKQATIHYE
ncbi:MAG: hypothetical protein Q4B68_07805 [Bacteroidales bacterium]|nr:hypothetical protein [Bacteroidales bacterium]